MTRCNGVITIIILLPSQDASVRIEARLINDPNQTMYSRTSYYHCYVTYIIDQHTRTTTATGIPRMPIVEFFTSLSCTRVIHSISILYNFSNICRLFIVLRFGFSHCQQQLHIHTHYRPCSETVRGTGVYGFPRVYSRTTLECIITL